MMMNDDILDLMRMNIATWQVIEALAKDPALSPQTQHALEVASSNVASTMGTLMQRHKITVTTDTPPTTEDLP